jgi:hypothetical protein
MTNRRIFSKVIGALVVVFPVILFFLLNVLTPYWWDDFPNMCFTVSWSVPRERLIGSFQDILQSTCNLYNNPLLAGNGRVFINFLQFVFCASGNKIIFDVCNTVVYTLFIMLVCYHSFGSFKKITPSMFLFVNVVVWLLTPAWGQDFLWLTGSLNYLWSLTLALLFLVPYRKKYADDTYTQNAALAIPLFVLGVITGWGMQNITASICVLLAGYFIRKLFRKEKICLFEILGAMGILIGFCFLLPASTAQFATIKKLIVNFSKSPVIFIRYCGISAGIVVAMGTEIFWFRKNKLDVLLLGYSVVALVSFFSLALGYVTERALLIPNVFLIIVGLHLLHYFHDIPKRCWVSAYVVVVLCVFFPSFYNGGSDIVKSYLFSQAREKFIYAERERGVSDIFVKTPIPVQNSHSGLSGGIDILSNLEDDDYKIHNTAKSLFYEVHSLTGVETRGETNLQDSFKTFLGNSPKNGSYIEKMFLEIYQNWDSK